MDKIKEKTQKLECVLPMLIKPVFVEDNFFAPIFNDVMEQELRKVSKWIMHEQIDKFYQERALEIIDELIEFNSKLLRKYRFHC